MIDGGKFSAHRAYQCMKLSHLAYGTEQNARTELGRLFFCTKVRFIENKETDTQVLVADWGKVSIAAFRGTQATDNFSRVDVVRNMRVGKRDWTDGSRVHAGYGDGADSVLRITGGLGTWRAEARERGQKVLLTGHSLGGSEATAATTELAPDATYTFGAPRVGDRRFVKVLSQHTVFRVVVGQDIAPSFPKRILNYRHGGQRWRLSTDAEYSLKGGFWLDFFHYPYVQGTREHEPNLYLDLTRRGYKTGEMK